MFQYFPFISSKCVLILVSHFRISEAAITHIMCIWWILWLCVWLCVVSLVGTLAVLLYIFLGDENINYIKILFEGLRIKAKVFGKRKTVFCWDVELNLNYPAISFAVNRTFSNIYVSMEFFISPLRVYVMFFIDRVIYNSSENELSIYLLKFSPDSLRRIE